MENKFSDIKIVMGLGNPDSGYKNTYHNAGKLMVDYLSEMLGPKDSDRSAKFRKKTPPGLFESRQAHLSFSGKNLGGQVGGIILVKPFNYMNENGKAAKSALKSLGAKKNSLLVIHDDSDLEIGKYKISFGRGSAGHNGVKSVIESIGAKDFWRVRIGVRRANPPSSRLPAGLRRARAGDFVLKKISEADKKTLVSVFKKASLEIFGKTGY